MTRRYRLPSRFILGLGTLQPRKNFDGLIRAFRSLIAGAAGAEHFADLHLVIGGGAGWMYEDTLEQVKHSGLEGRVHFPGYVQDEDLPGLYTLAAALAFPSWYEGFGLPVLEAQACGTPVVAANNSSLPEVVGGGGVLVDPGDTEELACALSCVLMDNGCRARLISAGHEQAAKFTWEKAAQQLLTAYHQATDAPGKL